MIGDKIQEARVTALLQEESFMADDMEKKNQQGNQPGQGQGGQSGQQGQHSGQPGQQSGQPGQPKKGGQGQNEEDDMNRDRQRRAS